MTRKEICVALTGNPNSGKTTVFNALTGSRQHVGNWPGVTVEKKEGRCHFQDYHIRLVDLPGVYSLTAYSLDEIIARDFIINCKPDVVVNIVDASNLERNLYLSVQLLEMQAKVVVALNMIDMAESRGYRVNINELSRLLGTPVVPLVATRSEGIEELLETVISVMEGRVETPGTQLRYGREVEEEINKLEQMISADSLSERFSPRWLAIKLLEEDQEILSKIEKKQVGQGD